MFNDKGSETEPTNRLRRSGLDSQDYKSETTTRYQDLTLDY